MKEFTDYVKTLGSVDQDILRSTIASISFDGREERVKQLREEASKLRKKIDERQKIIEGLKTDLLLANKAVQSLQKARAKNIVPVRSMIEQHCISLRNKIGELRPNDLLKEKANIEMLCDAIVSRRNVAVEAEAALGAAAPMTRDEASQKKRERNPLPKPVLLSQDNQVEISGLDLDNVGK